MINVLSRLFGLAVAIGLYITHDDWAVLVPLSTHVEYLIINFFIFTFAGQLVVDFLSWWYRRRKGLGSQQTDTVILGVQNIFYLLLAGAFVLTVLGFYSIDIHTLFTSLSIVAAAIAIVSKDYISEIISGIIISFSSELSIGDYIKIGNHKGKVIDLTLTKIALLNDDDDIIYIPNNTVYSSELVNYTKRAIRRVSIEFEVGFQHIQTIEALEQDLIDSLHDFHADIDPHSFNLRIVELNKDSIQLKFQYTISHRERELEQSIRRKTVRRVVNYVKQNWQTNAKMPETGKQPEAVKQPQQQAEAEKKQPEQVLVDR